MKAAIYATGIAGEYVDEGISGAKDRRPELDRLMSDAHERRSKFSGNVDSAL